MFVLMFVRLICSFALLFQLAALSGQQFVFRPLLPGNGLPGSECFTVKQDSKKYLWISTNVGLTRFNGRSFKTFTTANGLTDNTVFDTYEDEQGRVFYITSNSRLGYIKNDSAFTTPVSDSLAKKLRNGSRFIKSIADYNKDELLLGTQAGFFTLDKKTLSRLTFLPAPDSALLWVKTMHGETHCANYTDYSSHVLTADDVYTLCLETEKGKRFLRFDFEMIRVSALAVFKSTGLADGRVLIGFWDKVFAISPDGSSDTLDLPARLISMYQDRNGGIWITMFQNGVFYYPDGDLSKTPFHLLQHYSPAGILMDHEGGIWAGTLSDGVQYAASLNTVAYPGEKNLGIKLSALHTVGSHVLANTADNRPYLFSDKNTYNVFESLTGGDFRNEKQTYIVQDEFVYSSGPGGTLRLDKNFRPVKSIPDSLYSKTTLYNLATGPDKKIWGITFQYLCYMRNDSIFTDMTLPGRGKDIGIDNDGTIYVATHSGMYIRENNRLVQVKQVSCKVNRLKRDRLGNIWVCTHGDGVMQLKGPEIQRHYSITDGLPSGICYDIAFDDENNPWLATNAGLCCIRRKSGGTTVSVYGTEHGLLNEEILLLAILGDEIYLSTQKGLCAANMSELDYRLPAPPVYLLNVYNDTKKVTGRNSFSHRENNLSFHLEGITYRNPENLYYLYRLSGLDTNWRTSRTGELSFSNLGGGTYFLEAVAVTSEGVRSTMPAVYRFVIRQPFWESWWFILFLIAGAGIPVVALVVWRLRVIRKKEAEKTALNKLVAEYQMSAIRAQMNPHFIFNAINSIQNYVLNNETEYAYDYLTKFSSLIRKILTNSRRNTISLEKELEMLELYTELEQRRFKNRFSCQVIIEPNLPVEEIKIPVMLIQPFVENAIWHGIMNMEATGEGKLLIGMALQNEELVITIEDNGVGRARAMEIKKRGSHESIGMALSQERLETLKAIGYKDSRIVVADLYNGEKTPCGTRVQLFLPLKY
ncbi:MAG: signal transduction histidine kinase LytS [Bacteroidetes bacterium]|nr:MAG: signal transduction histidine kinase LytS [Bacteroidota bacterium]